MLTLNDGRNELWQWDTGRKLTVDAECSQVHFSNKVFGRSIDVDVVDGVATIPDVLLQTDKDLTAWAFVGTAEDGYTKISKVFKVNKRNKPAGYVFTPTDQTKLVEILERIEDLEKRPSGDVSKEDIQNAVNDYLDKNPISVDEKDPTVPEWAKQPEPPKVEIPECGSCGIPIPETAEVGQTIVVKAVDENGKPTEWECADFPEGSGLTNTARTLLMSVLRNGVYTSDQSANLTALEEALKSSGGGSDEPDVPDVPVEPDEPDVPGIVEEKLDFKFIRGVDTTTYVPDEPDMSNGSQPVACTSVGIGPIPSDGNAELRFTLDTTKVSKYKFRLFLYNSDGTPYKASGTLGSYQNPNSGDLTHGITLNEPGSVGRVYVDGDWSYKIPDGYSVLVQVEFADALQNNTVVDTTILDARGKIYGVIDKIAFDDMILHAYVVREG